MNPKQPEAQIENGVAYKKERVQCIGKFWKIKINLNLVWETNNPDKRSREFLILVLDVSTL